MAGLLALLLAAVFWAGGCHPGGKDDDERGGRKGPATSSTTKPDADDEGQKVKLTAEAIERYGVKVGKVQKHTLVPTFVVPARVAYNADAVARVGSAVPGRVVEVKAKLGDAVEAGGELLVVESTELGEAQSDLLQKRTALDAAAAAVEPAKASYERAAKLYESQGISLTEVQKREAEYKAAQAARQAARGAAEAAERKLGLLGMSADAVRALAQTGLINPRCSVRAPIAGRVVERNVTLGQEVGPASDALVVLADVSTLWVLADVPEARLADVSVGSKVRVIVPALKGKPVPGEVSFVPASVDPATRSVQVRVAVPGEGPVVLRPGMFAEAEIEAASERDKARDVIAVPEEAVQTIGGRHCVFVEDDDEEDTFIARPVAVGQEVNGLVPILSGLEEKEHIVKAGGFILKAELAKAAVKDND